LHQRLLDRSKVLVNKLESPESVRANNHRPKKWRPPKPQYLDWSTFGPSLFENSGDDTRMEELVTYRDHLRDLLRHEGKYVVIKGPEVIGIYAERHAALRKTVTRFGDQPVFVKQIVAKEPMISMGGVIL
jgi:hypothetical protein